MEDYCCDPDLYYALTGQELEVKKPAPPVDG